MQDDKRMVTAHDGVVQSASSILPCPVAPTLALPKGGGSIRGMGETFTANPVTGTGSMTIPLATSPGRAGFGPQLSLSYDSGAGNGPFGFGWSLSLPAITRKTDKGLPRYDDAVESDVFLLSGAEDLAPVLVQNATDVWEPETVPDRTVDGHTSYTIKRYRPRIEGLFARIERWTDRSTGEIHWRSITKDNVTTLYGKDNHSLIFDPAELDPADPTDLTKARLRRIFRWLICQSYDDKGNAIVYEYQSEDSQRIFEDPEGQHGAWAHERNRDDASRSAEPLPQAHPLRQPRPNAGGAGQPAALSEQGADRRRRLDGRGRLRLW